MKKLLFSAMFIICIQLTFISFANAQDAEVPNTDTKVQDIDVKKEDAQSSTGMVENRDFAFINNTGTTIHSIYFSPADANKFGDDILIPGASILTTNSQAYTWNDFPVSDCLWDIKYTTVDGTDYLVENVDLCQMRTVTFVGLTK